MKIEIDFRPTQSGNLARQKVFYGFRLYPETNKEMADLERGIELRQIPTSYQRNVSGDSIHYLVEFEEKTPPVSVPNDSTTVNP